MGATDEHTPEAFIKMDRAAARNDAAEAYRALRKLSDGDIQNASLAFSAGQAAQRAANPVAAVQCFERSVTAHGTRPRYWYFYGKALRDVRDHHRANYAFSQYARWETKAGRPFLKHLGGLMSFETAIRTRSFERPEYAHSVYHAGLLAKELGIPEIKIAELGVASGRGLLALQEHAKAVENLTEVRIRVYGFDTGTGLPPVNDPRDLPFFFSQGDYTMQEKERLSDLLQGTELILGDAAEKVPQWLNEGPPVGALLFDMDLYSSTKQVLDLLGDKLDHALVLPRVSMTFDDVSPRSSKSRLKDYSGATGEAAAISDYNRENSGNQILFDRHFWAYPEHDYWHDACYMMHRLSHPLYGKRIRESAPTERNLDS